VAREISAGLEQNLAKKTTATGERQTSRATLASLRLSARDSRRAPRTARPSS
jgi:hypothetical protein